MEYSTRVKEEWDFSHAALFSHKFLHLHCPMWWYSPAEELVLAPEPPGVNLRISTGKRCFCCNSVHRKRDGYAVWGKEIFLRSGDNMPSWMLWDYCKDVPGHPKSGESVQTGWWWLWENHIKLEREGRRAQLHAGSLEESTGLQTRSMCQDCLLLGWILPWITKHLLGEHKAYCPHEEGSPHPFFCSQWGAPGMHSMAVCCRGGSR